MTSRIEITNPRIIDFYNKHKNMNIERVNLWVIELFEKLGNQPDNDNKTFQENENYKNNNNLIGCIYGSPTKISDKILPDTSILVLEMNNSTNKIEGIGYIKNKIFIDEKKIKIYNDNNYNHKYHNDK